MDANVFGEVRSSYRPAFSEGQDRHLSLNTGGELIVAQGLPPIAQLVSCGGSYQAATTTAATPVTAIPTTAALIGLWNGEPDGGKSYVIDSVFVVCVATTAAALQHMGILGNMSMAQIPTAIANTITPRSLRGGFGYQGAARVAVGITLGSADGVASNWFPIGPSSIGTATIQVGAISDVDCQGRFIVPPKGQFSLTCLAGTATASSIQIGMRWHEVILPNNIA